MGQGKGGRPIQDINFQTTLSSSRPGESSRGFVGLIYGDRGKVFQMSDRLTDLIERPVLGSDKP